MTWKPQSEAKKLARNEQERNRYHALSIAKKDALIQRGAHLRRKRNVRLVVVPKINKRHFDPDLGYWLTASWFKG